MSHRSQEHPAIEISGLSKGFGRTAVLRGLDLQVEWGEVLTVLGPNGSGKTTLIRVLATLARPDEGDVHVAGADLSRMGKYVRSITGVVTHEPLLYGDLTGHENLKFVGRMFGLDNVDDRIASVADRLGITSRLHQRTGTLSHGLQKRFSIARALLHDPPVLLMDEPDSGLDQEAQARLDEVVQEKKRSSGAVVMTTHNLDRGLAVGDRLAVLSRGRVAYHEPIDTDARADLARSAYQKQVGVAR